ncbi:hypothetical protein FKM82_023350 [Ascaphus truei]
MVRKQLMDGVRRYFSLNVLLLCLSCFGSCSRIIEGPSNATVLSGSDAQFRCTVSQGWLTLLWFYEERAIVSINPVSGAVVGNGQIIMRNDTNTVTGAFTSEMTIINVARNDTGLIKCSSLSSNFETAFLSVQVNGSLQITNSSLTVISNETTHIVCKASGWHPAPHINWQINSAFANDYVTDNTIGTDNLYDAVSILTISPQGNVSLTCQASIEALAKPQSVTVDLLYITRGNTEGKKDNTEIIIIAVTVSIAVVLLMIIIIVIIIYCRKKKQSESRYQSELRKISARNAKNLSIGKSNHGYNPDPSAIKRPLPSLPSTSPNSSVIGQNKLSAKGNATSPVSNYIDFECNLKEKC